MSALVGAAYWAALAMALQVVTPTDGVDLRDTLTEAQREWWDLAPESRKKGLLCARRAGKSTLLARWLVAGAIDAGENEWSAYISLTRKSAREAMWPEIRKAAELAGVAHVVNEANLTVTFAGGGCVLLGGLETVRDVERYRGKKYRRAAFDECGAMRDSLLRRGYEQAVEPGTMDVDGEIAFGGTPGYVPEGLWYEISRDGAEESTGIPIRRWTALDNPHLPHAAAWLERIKAEKGWTDDTPTYVREYRPGRWVVDLGALVFPCVPGRNTIAALPTHNGQGLALVPQKWRRVIALDIGVRDPTAIVVLASHEDLAYRRFVLSAEKRSEWLTRELASRLRQLQAQYPDAPLIADTGGMGAYAAMELSRDHHLPIESADKAGRLASVFFTRDGLISGSLQLLPEAKELEDEWRKIRWSEKKPGEPAEGDDHCSDAARYGLRRLHHHVLDEHGPADPKTPAQLAAEEIERFKGQLEHEADERARKASRQLLRRVRRSVAADRKRRS
ncbi:MAG: terminase family protein [Myxococcales bacterium]|nr:terminase family protein [Myxococcales bacterium]